MAHRYWRLAFDTPGLSLGPSATAWAFAEVQFRTVAGTPRSFTGGTASAAVCYGGTPSANDASKATDGSNSTSYSSIDASAGQWWQYDYGAGNAYDIVQVAITSISDSFYAPRQSPHVFRVQCSDDGSTWTNLVTCTSSEPWNSTTTQLFAVPPPGASVAVPAGHITFTGLAPSTVLSVAVPAGNITFTGLAPTVSLDGATGVPAGAINFTGFAPASNVATEVASGSATFTGFAPTSVVGAAPGGTYVCVMT